MKKQERIEHEVEIISKPDPEAKIKRLEKTVKELRDKIKYLEHESQTLQDRIDRELEWKRTFREFIKDVYDDHSLYNDYGDEDY